MAEFFSEYWYAIALALSVVAMTICLTVRGETETVKEILFKLVTEAERLYGSGTGDLKRAAVIEWIYPKMPALLRTLLTAERLGELVEEALTLAKAKWL